MEPVYEPFIPLAPTSAQALNSSPAPRGGARHAGRLRRLLEYLAADPVGERFAHQRGRDERLLLGR